MVSYIPAALIILSVFVSVFIGILMNRRDATLLRDDMNRGIDELNRRLTLIESDQKHFFTITGRMDGRIDEIAKR